MFKLLILVFVCLTCFVSCGSEDSFVSPEKSPCTVFDKSLGFSRCQTKEVVCYISKGGEQCWALPPPAAAQQQQAPQVPVPGVSDAPSKKSS